MADSQTVSFATFSDFLRLFSEIPEQERLSFAQNLTTEQLAVRNRNIYPPNLTPAHWLVMNRLIVPELLSAGILRLADGMGVTVAHYLAEKTDVFPPEILEPDILSLADYSGKTVAHYIVQEAFRSRGNKTIPEKFFSEDTLMLSDNDGVTVAQSLFTYWHGYIPEEYLTDRVLRSGARGRKIPLVSLWLQNRVIQSNDWRYLYPALIEKGKTWSRRNRSRITGLLCATPPDVLQRRLSLIPAMSLRILLGHAKNERLSPWISRELDSRLVPELSEKWGDTNTGDSSPDQAEDLYATCCGSR